MSKMILIDEATVKQALEVLEEVVDLVRQEYSTDWRRGLPTRKSQLEGMKAGLDAHEAAITALRESLAQPEQEPVLQLLLQSKRNHERNFGASAAADWIYSDLLDLLDAAPAQPEQQENLFDLALKADNWGQP